MSQAYEFALDKIGLDFNSYQVKQLPPEFFFSVLFGFVA